MKINFRNKAAKLTLSNLLPTCKRCPFYEVNPCPFGMSTIVDCYGKGWWIDGESVDIFRV